MFIDGSEAVSHRQNHSASSPDLKALTFCVSFNGWRRTNKNFRSWAAKMAALHKPTWRKVGIFEAVMASTYKIHRNTDLVLGIAEKWCPDTKTFVFPWGETTITLEDVMVLLGFSVLGSPVFATLDSSAKKTKAKLEKEMLKIRKDKNLSFVTQLSWMRRFVDSGDELEHVAFLALWLSYYVFPSRYHHVTADILSIAVHLSTGTRIALAPAVLARLYTDLSLLKNHIRAFCESDFTVETDMTALFKLVQVWTWERFRELRPRKTNPLLKGEPRLALWRNLKQRTNCVRQILDNSSFEWRPYTKAVKNWEFPQFYPENGMWVRVSPNLDDEFISFARCIKVSTLVGLDSVEQYFPNRVASQFGILQDVPCPVNRNNLSQVAAWNDYNKPIDDLTLYIPSRAATPRVISASFCEWRRKSYPEFQYSSEENRVVESAGTLKAGNIVSDETSSVPFGSKMNRTSMTGIKVAEESTNERRKCMKRARDEIRNHVKRVDEDDESTIGRCQTQFASDNDEDDDHSFVPSGSEMNRTSEDGMKRWQYMKRTRDKRHKYMKQARDKIRKYMKRICENDEEDSSLTIAQIMKKNSDVRNSRGDASEPLGKKSRLEALPCQKLTSIRADGDEVVPPPEIKQRDEETDEMGSKAGKRVVLSPDNETNYSDPPVGFDGAVDIVVSPPGKRQSCDDELDVYGSNVEKMNMIDDGSNEPEFFLREDGATAGEKDSSESLTQKEDDVDDDEPALKADMNELIPGQKLASGGANGDETSEAYKGMVLSPSDQSNIHIAVGDGTQGQDCLIHDDGLRSEGTKKSNEQLEDLEKRNDDFAEGDAFDEVKVLAWFEERIIKAETWLKERRAMKQRKIAAMKQRKIAAARLI